MLSSRLPRLRRLPTSLRVLTPRPRRRRSPSRTTGAVFTSAPMAVGVRAAIVGISFPTGGRVGHPLREGCSSRSGGLLGGQIGYRWQASQWVFGVEAQGDWADLSHTRVSLLEPTFSLRTKTDGIGLFTGQIGYAWNAALLYIKGGAAVTSNRFSVLDNLNFGAELASASSTRWGGVVGVGFEYGFAPNWSVGLEYDHLFMGDANNTFNFVAPLAGVVLNNRVSQDVDSHLARQLPLRRLWRPGHREVLIAATASRIRKGRPRAGLFLFGCPRFVRPPQGASTTCTASWARDNSFTFNAGDSRGPIAFVRASTSSPRASATNSLAPSSRNTDSARRASNTKRPASRRPFRLVVPRDSAYGCILPNLPRMWFFGDSLLR